MGSIALTKHLVGAQKRAAVLIDWTQIQGELCALTASVPFKGHSIPILSRSYTEKELYVVRLRNDHSVVEFGLKGTREYERPTYSDWFARATDKARCFGGGLPYASSVGARIVLGPRPPKASKRKK